MTRSRIYGSDTPFCAWMRSRTDLPSYGDPNFGFVASDNDVTIHRYLSEVDGIGTREVQGLMQIEVKTRRSHGDDGGPATNGLRSSQIDTLSKLNLFCGDKRVHGQWIRFFGVFLIVMDGTTPANSSTMWWGVLPKNTVLGDWHDAKWRRISMGTLISLLRFDRHPRTLQTHPLRRHHKTSSIMVTERAPLGFPVERRLVMRS